MNSERVVVQRAQAVPGRFSYWFGWLIRIVAAGLLLVAGAGKLSDRLWVHRPVDGLAFGGMDAGLWAAVELAVGVWLFVRWRQAAAVQAALYLFAAFLGVSAYGVWSHWPSCGCFGQWWDTTPATMLVLDSVMVVGLLWLSRQGAAGVG